MRGGGVGGYRLYQEHSDHRGRFVFTCEHASNRVTRYELTERDKALLNEHWGLDIGAAALVEALCQRTGSTGVLSTESRLVIDVNRDPTSKTLIVSECDGIPVSFNQSITAEDRIWRQSIFDGYHRAVGDVLSQRLEIRPDTKTRIDSQLYADLARRTAQDGGWYPLTAILMSPAVWRRC